MNIKISLLRCLSCKYFRNMKTYLLFNYLILFFFQLHAVSRTQQGRPTPSLVLDTPFPTFCQILVALRVEW